MRFEPRHVGGRALAAMLLFAWPVYTLGPGILEAWSPLHARLTSALLGGDYADIRVLTDAAHTIELRATTTVARTQCDVSVLLGDVWVVRTSALHISQQWLIALVLLASMPTRSSVARLQWCAITVPLVLALQFATLPVLLAAGVEDVVCHKNATAAATLLPPTSLLTIDALLQNGGLWLLTLVTLALTWLLAHRGHHHLRKADSL